MLSFTVTITSSIITKCQFFKHKWFVIISNSVRILVTCHSDVSSVGSCSATATNQNISWIFRICIDCSDIGVETTETSVKITTINLYFREFSIFDFSSLKRFIIVGKTIAIYIAGESPFCLLCDTDLFGLLREVVLSAVLNMVDDVV